MPELKSVYFAPDGEWFATRGECERYEKEQEVGEYIFPLLFNKEAMREIAIHICKRYTMEQRYDYVPEDENKQPEDV